MVGTREARSQPPAIHILAALLDGTPEAILLRKAVSPPATLHVINTRAGVLAALHGHSFDVVVFPMLGQDRLPTSPLIRMSLQHRPSRTVLLLCAAPPPRSSALLAASRAGAHVLVAPSVVDVSSALSRATRLSARDALPDCETLALVEPPILRQLLCAASKTVAENGHVGAFARHLHVSTRTLGRYTERAGLASPHALLSAARVLWACAFMESSREDARAVALQTGFGDLHALLLAMRRHLKQLSPNGSTVRLPTYRDALRPVVGSLGGRLVL
jgi:AraC-like DNA-binding protein